jgi:diguanylate cyclase (GGDEF)-like protein/PAS domain S-box-containing protein
VRPCSADGTTRVLAMTANNLLDDPAVQGIVVSAHDDTDRADLDVGISELARRFEVAFENSVVGRALVGVDGRMMRVNGALCSISGFSAEQLVGMSVFDLAHDDDAEHDAAMGRQLVTGEIEHEEGERRLRRADGSWRWIRRTVSSVSDQAGQVQYVSIDVSDITEMREAQRRIAQVLDVIESSTDIIVFTDRHGRIEYSNAKATELLGTKPGDESLAALDELFTADSLVKFSDEVLPELAKWGIWTGDLTVRATTGEHLRSRATVQFHFDPDGRVALVSAVAHDIGELMDTQAQLAHQATHDPLTKLPNRNLFQELGEQALARADRDGTQVAVLFLDLDRFKPVNDTFGHAVGDDLLVEVAGRLRTCVRRGDVVARFGGDEFLVLCEHPAGQPEMHDLAGRLIEAVSPPAQLGKARAQVGVSVGIAIGAGGRVTIDTLLRDADAALYRAKEQGRGRAVLFGSTATG